MTKLVYLVMILLVNSASAIDLHKCKSDFARLQNRELTKLKSAHTVSVVATTNLAKLKRVEAQAVRDYLKYVQAEIPEWGLTVSARQYWDLSAGETVGYRVEVDGGEEAMAHFYYRLEVSTEDIWDKLLYYKWHNQSPVEEWVCQGY